jgi:hypothetical protein
MSMDRLSRVIAGCCLTLALGLVFSGTGCRSMRNDVPRGKPYTTTGNPPPAVGFNSDPHPSTSVAPGMYQNNGSGGFDVNPPGAGPTAPQYGTPSPNTSPYGVPTTGGKYGGPGTNSGSNQ